MYTQSLTAAYLYESHLREELTRRLGVAWTPIVNGIADLDGISKHVLRTFSTRRAEIEALMALGGESSPRAGEIASLDTRRAKDHDLDLTALRDGWIETAATLGYTPQHLNGLVDVSRPNALVPAHRDLLTVEQRSPQH